MSILANRDGIQWLDELRLQAATHRIKINVRESAGEYLQATSESRCLALFLAGEMAEWLKAHAWKACLLERVTWVRIPLSPPDFLFSIA